MSNRHPFQLGITQRVLTLVQQRRSATVEEIVNTMQGVTAKQASSALTNLWTAGKLHKARTGYHDTRYFAEAADRDTYLERVGEWTPPAERRSMPMSSRATLDKRAPVIVPDHVKVTVCPAWTHDPRIQFAPDVTRLPAGLKGAGFVAEWNRLRRRSVPAKGAA